MTTQHKDGRAYFFCGIGGSGMSALAALMAARGAVIRGSDRARDRGQTPEKFAAMERTSYRLFPQDGSGVTADMAALVVSSAIESSIPDVGAALSLGVPIVKRAELLSSLFNGTQGIAIAGTSGKTTVTAMAGYLLSRAGLDPTIVNGGLMLDFPDEAGAARNTVCGESDYMVCETDESDGSIALYTPSIAVLTNVALDHKPLEELRPLFAHYLCRARAAAIVNADDAEALGVSATAVEKGVRILTYGVQNDLADIVARDLEFRPDGAEFTVWEKGGDQSAHCRIGVPGRHNVSNALAAIAAARALGVSLTDAAAMMAGFSGTHRRLERVGVAGGVTVIDDFAHNPDKIAASLSTLKEFPGRLLVVFQPHGYGPTRMLREGLAKSFSAYLGEGDMLLMPEIYYAGGTAAKTISSADIIADVRETGRTARFFGKREDIPPFLKTVMREGDRVVVMGARDDTLPAFAADILALARRGG